MVWAIFYLATTRKAEVGGAVLNCPVDFLRLTDDRLLIADLAKDSDIRKIIHDIRSRRLWKKALVIARNTVPENMHNDAGGSPKALFAGVAFLAGNAPAKIAARRQIADEIWKAAKEPCEQHEVWLDVPKPPSMDESKEMWIEAKGHAAPEILNNFIPVQQWVELYGTHQCRAHVFCPPAVGRQIGEAAEAVFKEKYGLEFLPQARVYCDV
jgi:hypothetical protein